MCFFALRFALQLKRQLEEEPANKARNEDLERKIEERTVKLKPVYHTVAINFADLHDTPERMLEKGCINEIVAWRGSRQYLFWRLRRLLLEDYFVGRILGAQDSLSVGQAQSMLRRWFVEDMGATEAYMWDSNEKMVDWLEKQKDSESIVQRNISSVRKAAIVAQIQKSLEVGGGGGLYSG